MNPIVKAIPEDPAALRQIVDLQLSTLVQRDARIASLCGIIAAIRAAANGDLSPETDTETLVRNLYHANEDLRQANAMLRREVERAKFTESVSPAPPERSIAIPVIVSQYEL